MQNVRAILQVGLIVVLTLVAAVVSELDGVPAPVVIVVVTIVGVILALLPAIVWNRSSTRPVASRPQPPRVPPAPTTASPAVRAYEGGNEWRNVLVLFASGSALLLLNAVVNNSGFIDTLDGAFYWIPAVISWLLLVLGPFVFAFVAGMAAAVELELDNLFLAFLFGTAGFGVGVWALFIASPWST